MRVTGIVQGVGFRPFVFGLAGSLGLAGWVYNDAHGVLCEVEGNAADVATFVGALRERPPPLAVVAQVIQESLPPTGETGFVIAPSPPGGHREALVSPDVATCEACLRELADPADRRYRYPFINCTNCGPRYSIVLDVPYDRPSTTMAGFAMCADCRAEYDDPADRRFHAQPVCCPACGPSVRLVDATGRELGEPGTDPIAATAELLQAGNVVAVKGLGGYHLAALASDESAVGALRARKHREDKPFAVLAADLATARTLCRLTGAEEHALASIRRPIVLAARRGDAPIAPSVAPATRDLGLLLPYTPLHQLLAAAIGEPFVLTSGNVSDEPIAYRDDDALVRLAGIADAFLVHDRPIHARTDDSVVRVVRDVETPVRRSRGYAPQPLPLHRPLARPVLGCGAELKNTFCLAAGDRAFVSPHVGDLENAETLAAYAEGIEHFSRLFDISPQVVAHDLHPDYLSTKYALDLSAVELLGVQHHHAHIASCLADNGVDGPVIGVAFDGLGYGADGTIWGGEFLVADLAGFERAGSLAPVPMPGGAAAIREPWRMAASYAHAAYGDAAPPLAVAGRHPERWTPVTSMARSGLNAPATSSAGRLFDAAAALAGVRDEVSYEGQAAIELEQRAWSWVDRPEPVGGEQQALQEGVGRYDAGVDEEGTVFRVRGIDLARAVIDDVAAGIDQPTIAARFHRGLADAVVAACARIRDAGGPATVALSGGVWQNALLVELVGTDLQAAGFAVLTHHRVPPNDGGISLGQVAVAAARD